MQRVEGLAPVRRRARDLTPRHMANYRSAVFAAARSLFLARGFDAVSVSDIAEAAGVPGHVPGHYFGGKSMILRRIAADLEHRVLTGLKDVGDGGDREGFVAVLLGADPCELCRFHQEMTRQGLKAAEAWRGKVETLMAQIIHERWAVSPAVARQTAWHFMEGTWLFHADASRDAASVGAGQGLEARRA